MNRASVVRGIPEPGQLVKVRGQPFAVTDVKVSTLPQNQRLSSYQPTQHLVSLSSLEDDALGEELQVIWELEPGAIIFESAQLPYPDGFDSSDRLDAFLDAVRWGAASTADVRNVQSLSVPTPKSREFQLRPVPPRLVLSAISAKRYWWRKFVKFAH